MIPGSLDDGTSDRLRGMLAASRTQVRRYFSPGLARQTAKRIATATLVRVSVAYKYFSDGGSAGTGSFR